MHLADHIRPLLREHDCVIIPEFGGLVTEMSPARAQPGRQVLSPPTKLVAFNQALTRNDGLLVDALTQQLGLAPAQAREAVRTAVASLQQELAETSRTELPGIGIFRRAEGRGLAFEYTGTDNLLPSAFGLPELAVRPVRASVARGSQPLLRSAATRRSRWARLASAGVITLAASLLLLVNYQFASTAGYLPAEWRMQLPWLVWAQNHSAPATSATEPQQATLGQHDFTSAPPAASAEATPLAASAAVPAPENSTQPDAVPADEAAGNPETTPVAAAPTEKALVAARAGAKAKISKPALSASKAAGERWAARPAASTIADASTTIKTRTGRYYVIAGAYSTLSRAELGRKELVRAGHAAHIILPPYGSRFFRVTAADYPDLASAQREAQRLRVSTHSDYNTLKF
ncbi:SPOR domain-containing protein [Hymenobacter sp. BT664]|uniref:SPOR domain-containing protein n=1 Tax=Hymenobacter montanus TaxID=2771359 RepID=A0A927BDW2_9BACT|nr:SPOR domain-containing protein [Hymenobacter montanus]MBD2768364.1 SPOR domain-containing protein [Hymenobacter montanus]